MQIKKYLKNNWDMASTVTITLIAFFVMFGFNILDVYNTDFVNKGGDFTVTYLGSVFYRLDEWRWPIFTHTNLAYPYGISVHGTDGSPLLSIIFKALTKVFNLPATVQFVGIWMLISYILQAIVSVLIFRHAFKNKFLVILGALFFVSAPIMLMRVFVHINLMPHFILLFAILLWLNNKLGLRQWVYMGILYSLGILTCPYFLPMQTGFFALLWYQQVWVEKKVSWKTLFIGITSLMATLGVWFCLLGMLSTGQQLSSGGWRGLGLNLTALFNPIWSKSQVINTLTPKADFDADNYFGLGLLLLLILCFRQVLQLFKHDNLKKHAPLALLLLGLFLFAVSSQIKLATNIVFDYNPGAFMNWIGGVFRYSGRFFWSIWYLLAFFLIRECYRKFHNKAFILLPLLLMVQVWDLYPSYKSKSDFVRYARPVHVETNSPEWDILADKYDKVFIFAHNKNYRDVWKWAIKHNKKVNYGFLNRPSKKTHELISKTKEEILSGYVSDPTYFYVIDEDFMKQINDVAKSSPSVEVLRQAIRRIGKYDILEYNPDLRPQTLSFMPKTIGVTHQYWTADLKMTAPYRVYRLVDNEYKDFASIRRFDGDVLELKWDKYDLEVFRRGRDGRYYQVIDGKSIESEG